MTSAAEDGWATATRKGRRRRTGPSAGQHSAAIAATGPAAWATQHPTEQQVRQWCSRVEEAEREVAASAFYRPLPALLAATPPTADDSGGSPGLLPSQLVVYGLGSLEQPGGVHIRYQLALSRLLAGALQHALAPPLAFDPVFSPLDRAVLEACGIQVLRQDEQGRRVATQSTLFYMPHCEGSLTDALLAANVAANTLHNVIILGNSFRFYADLWGTDEVMVFEAEGEESFSEERPKAMLALWHCGAVQETQISEAGFPISSAFNDISLQRFEPDWRQRLKTLGTQNNIL